MPATVETPTTLLTSAGTSTATKMLETVWTPTTRDVRGKLGKTSSEQRKIRKKNTKRVKVAPSLV
jgi:hypothetical protein